MLVLAFGRLLCSLITHPTYKTHLYFRALLPVYFFFFYVSFYLQINVNLSISLSQPNHHTGEEPPPRVQKKGPLGTYIFFFKKKIYLGLSPITKCLHYIMILFLVKS